MTDLKLGETYHRSELPDNDMDSNGLPEWVSDE